MKKIKILVSLFLAISIALNTNIAMAEETTSKETSEQRTIKIEYDGTNSDEIKNIKNKKINLIVANGVKSIGDLAFACCSNIISVKIPSSVTKIGSQAFCGCTSITSLTIPSSVISIGDSAFSDCNSIKNVTLPSSLTSISDHAFSGCDSITSITIPLGVKSIEESAFDYCSMLTDVTISASVKTIKTNAFNNCISLKSIDIPSSVNYIGKGAFSNCYKLTSIQVDKENNVFDSRDNCNAIIKKSNNELVVGCTRTYIPLSVTSIGNRAFDGCKGLTKIYVPSKITSIGDGAFEACYSLKSIDIPSSVISIGDSAFSQCYDLKSIYIPSSVTSIGKAVFSYCEKIANISVDKNNAIYDSREDCNGIIKTSNNKLIAGCIKTVIPSSVTLIGDYAFCGYSGLKNIDIPLGVTSIGTLAFHKCGLNSIDIPSTVTSIENSAFDDCKLSNLTLSQGLKSIGYNAFGGCNRLTSINLPSSLMSIGDLAFAYCTGLTEITIQSGLTSIGNETFSNCSNLTSIEIPTSVTSIGNEAFLCCSKLSSITIPAGLISIGDNAFAYCTGLTNIDVDKDNIKYDSRDDCNAIIKTESNELIVGCSTTVIYNGITSIANNAFNGCFGLTSIDIPSSVTLIGDSAFRGCKDLTDVTIPPSTTSIGKEAFLFCDNITIYGYKNSYAETYANENNIKFVTIREPDDFDYALYKANKFLNNSSVIDNSLTLDKISDTMADRMVEWLGNDDKLMAEFNTWMYSNVSKSPSTNYTEHTLDEIGYYEQAIYDAMQTTMYSNEFIEGLNNSYTSDYLTIVKNAIDICKLGKGDYEDDFDKELSNNIDDYFKLTKNELTDTLSNPEKTDLQKRATVLGVPLETAQQILDSTKTVYEFIQQVLAYDVLKNISSSQEMVLIYMSAKCPSDNKPLLTALNNVISAVQSADASCWIAWKKTGIKTLNDCADGFFKAVMDSSPFTKGLVIGNKISRIAVNKDFNTDEIIKNYYLMKNYCEIQKLIGKAVEETKNNFSKNKTHENAEAFITAVNMASLSKQNCNASAMKMAEFLYAKGGWNNFKQTIYEGIEKMGFKITNKDVQNYEEILKISSMRMDIARTQNLRLHKIIQDEFKKEYPSYYKSVLGKNIIKSSDLELSLKTPQIAKVSSKGVAITVKWSSKNLEDAVVGYEVEYIDKNNKSINKQTLIPTTRLIIFKSIRSKNREVKLRTFSYDCNGKKVYSKWTTYKFKV